MKNYWNEYAYTKMPFGKFKGRYLKNIPDDYIRWAVVHLEDRACAEMMSVELQRRDPRLRRSPK